MAARPSPAAVVATAGYPAEAMAAREAGGLAFLHAADADGAARIAGAFTAMRIVQPPADGTAASGASAAAPKQRTTRIRPMAEDPDERDLHNEVHHSQADVEAVIARARDKRGAAAKLRLAQRVGAQVSAVDNKAAQLVRAHNEMNRLAVEQGRVQDLPYLEELVNSMRGSQSHMPDVHGRLGRAGARQQRRILDALMKQTERRNESALTDLIAKVCSSSRVQRKPSSEWHIISGTNGEEATEYLLYKSKSKNALGQAFDYGFVIVCYDTENAATGGSPSGASSSPASDGSCVHRSILSIMQRAKYIESMLLYTCLECLQNFDLANELLLRLQQKEFEERADIGTSRHMSFREALMDLEDELHAFAEDQGSNTAVKTGEGVTSFELHGALSQNAEELVAVLLNLSETLQALLKSIGQALRPASASK